MVDGVNFFNQNQEIKLQNRGARSSGITFELKSVFEDLVNKGVIRDKDGKGLTKADALNLFNKLDSIHKNTNRATNYTSMQAGQSFTYSAAEMKALAEAAGYEIVNSGASPAGEKPELDKGEVNPLDIAKPHTPPENLVLSAGVKQAISEQTLEVSDAKTFTRDVNGEKQKIAVLRDEDGNKVRRLINEDGTMGETLVPVSTFGKNKYITQTKMDDMIKNVFPEGLPEGVTASFVTIGGTPQLVFKKDGQTLDQAQLRELVKEQSNNSVSGVSVQSAEVNNAEVINGSAVQQSETLASPAAEPINQEPVEHNINNEKTVGTYTFLPDGNGGYRLDAKMQLFGGPEANKFFKTMSIGSGNKAEYDKKTGQYSFRGISSNSRQGLNDILMNISNQVSMNNAIYKDLLSKQQSGVELSDVEKKFMEDHLESLKQYNLGVDAQGNLIDTTQETHRRRGRR